MNKSDSIIKFAPAFLKAQKAIRAAVKADVNPFYKKHYATIESVIDASKKPLNDNGIAVLQSVGNLDSGETYIETMLLHESGEFLSDKMKVTMEKEGPQGQGSAITYARRYSLQSMVLLPAEDDDAESATIRDKKPNPKTDKPVPMSKLQQEELMEFVNKLPDKESKSLLIWMKKGGINRQDATKMLNKCRDMVAAKKEDEEAPISAVDRIDADIDKRQQQDEIPF